MKAGMIKDLLKWVDADADVYIHFDGYDEEVAKVDVDVVHNFVTLSPIDADWGDDDGATHDEGDDEDVIEGECTSVCALPEPESGVSGGGCKDL